MKEGFAWGGMMLFRISCITAMALCLGAGTAFAAGNDWQPVMLDNNPDFTIDVPAVVKNDYKPSAIGAKQGEVMDWDIKWDDGAELTCTLDRLDYSNKVSPKHRKEMAEQEFADTKLRNNLCTDGDKDYMLESTSFTANGQPVGECTSFTGGVAAILSSVMLVAARHHIYRLDCAAYFLYKDDTDATLGDAQDMLSNYITPTRQSLHLPAAER